MARLFGLSGALPNFPPRYNVAPTQDVPIIHQQDGTRALAFVRWGLVPSWAKELPVSQPLINARSESVNEKPSFRSAFRRRRALMPADGFYEWHRPDDGPKQPYNIHSCDGSPFAMASIWEVWTAPDGSELRSCAILTTSANATLKPIHHRMPVILDAANWDAWLTTPESEAASLLPLLVPAPDDLLIADPVSTKVNRVANDSPDLIAPLEGGQSAAEQGSLF